MIDLCGTIAEKRDPGFSKIVVFEFYDGPEKGIAFDGEGHGLRFISVGDSKSRMFRAFMFEEIDADWASIADRFKAEDSIIVTSLHSGEVTKLNEFLLRGSVLKRSLGVGPPYLEWVAGFIASSEQIEMAENEGFDFVHSCLK